MEGLLEYGTYKYNLVHGMEGGFVNKSVTQAELYTILVNPDWLSKTRFYNFYKENQQITNQSQIKKYFLDLLDNIKSEGYEPDFKVPTSQTRYF